MNARECSLSVVAKIRVQPPRAPLCTPTDRGDLGGRARVVCDEESGGRRRLVGTKMSYMRHRTALRARATAQHARRQFWFVSCTTLPSHTQLTRKRHVQVFRCAVWVGSRCGMREVLGATLLGRLFYWDNQGLGTLGIFVL